jgi:hypothetical protein
MERKAMKGRDKRRKAKALKALRNKKPRPFSVEVPLSTAPAEGQLPEVTLSTQSDLLRQSKKVS